VRKFLGDGFILMASQLVSRILAFSVSFVLARNLGLSALAVLALAQSIMAYATVAGDAGLGTEAVRRLSTGENRRRVVKETVSLQVTLTVIALVVILPVSIWQVGLSLSAALVVTPLAAALTCSYVLQSDLDAVNMAVSRVIMNVVTGLSGLALVLMGAALPLVALSYGVGAVAAMFFTNMKSRVKISRSFQIPTLKSFSRGPKSFAALVGFTTIVHSYSSLLLIMAAFLAGGSLLVDTSVATRFLLLLVLPAQILGSMLLPRYAKLTTRPNLLRHGLVALCAGIFIATGVSVTANWFVPALLGSDASASVGAVIALAWQVPFSLMSTIYTSYFLGKGEYQKVFGIYAVALLFLIALAVYSCNFGSVLYVSSLVASEIVFVILLIVTEYFWRKREKHVIS
jgi:O-antigen/teichoic acid export membrane protein